MSAVIHDMNTPSCDTTLQQNLPLKKYKYFIGTMLTSTVTYIGSPYSTSRQQWMPLNVLAAV
jgi:hypothetical protein